MTEGSKGAPKRTEVSIAKMTSIRSIPMDERYLVTPRLDSRRQRHVKTVSEAATY